MSLPAFAATAAFAATEEISGKKKNISISDRFKNTLKISKFFF